MDDKVVDLTRHAKFYCAPFRCFCYRYTWFFIPSVFWLVFTLFGFFQLAYTPNKFIRKIRQYTSFPLSVYLLGVTLTTINIWTLKYRNTAIFRNQFSLDRYFAAENRINMEMIQHKLRLIVIISPWKLYSEETIQGQKNHYVWFWGTPMHRSRNTVQTQ